MHKIMNVSYSLLDSPRDRKVFLDNILIGTRGYGIMYLLASFCFERI